MLLRVPSSRYTFHDIFTLFVTFILNNIYRIEIQITDFVNLFEDSDDI